VGALEKHSEKGKGHLDKVKEYSQKSKFHLHKNGLDELLTVRLDEHHINKL
jgi:hypothetical protein